VTSSKNSRGFVPTTIFTRFEKRDGTKISAAKVHEGDVAPIREFWKLDTVEVGNWIVLKPNGNVEVLTVEEFQELIS